MQRDQTPDPAFRAAPCGLQIDSVTKLKALSGNNNESTSILLFVSQTQKQEMLRRSTYQQADFQPSALRQAARQALS
jgi:hypothetical protein